MASASNRKHRDEVEDEKLPLATSWAQLRALSDSGCARSPRPPPATSHRDAASPPPPRRRFVPVPVPVPVPSRSRSRCAAPPTPVARPGGPRAGAGEAQPPRVLLFPAGPAAGLFSVPTGCSWSQGTAASGSAQAEARVGQVAGGGRGGGAPPPRAPLAGDAGPRPARGGAAGGAPAGELLGTPPCGLSPGRANQKRQEVSPWVVPRGCAALSPGQPRLCASPARRAFHKGVAVAVAQAAAVMVLAGKDARSPSGREREPAEPPGWRCPAGSPSELQEPLSERRAGGAAGRAPGREEPWRWSPPPSAATWVLEVQEGCLVGRWAGRGHLAPRRGETPDWGQTREPDPRGAPASQKWLK